MNKENTNRENINRENINKENMNGDKQLNRVNKNKSIRLDQKIKK